MTNNPKVLSYILAEIRRQGHDVEVAEDGGIRAIWMLRAWRYMTDRPRMLLDADGIRLIGKMVEPEKNAHGFRECGVRVGNRICPPQQDVPLLIDKLVERQHELTPNEFYLSLMEIHPWIDGNGRSGKVIFNRLNNTMDDPVLPTVPGDWEIP